MANGKKILVVDDDPDIQSFCKSVLEAKGYTVACLGEAKQVSAAVKKEQPDLVILDVMMEEIDSGFKIAQMLGNEPSKPAVLMLSSIADASYLNFDTTALPVNELVQKPIRPEDLVVRVQKLLEKKK